MVLVDSLVHEKETLLFLLGKMTSDKIILGSDYPFPLGEHHPGKMISEMHEIDSETKRKLLGLNACRFLGLDPDNYAA